MENGKTKKKMTNAQWERRVMNAIIHVDKTKDTRSVYFDDKGLRLTVTEDSVVISTMFHDHVFARITSSGWSRPYLYTERVVDIVLSLGDACRADDGGGLSWLRALEVLKADAERASEYNICVYYDWWLFNIFAPLYGIGETTAEAFLVYEDFIHNVARNVVLRDEHKEDVTNRAFLKAIADNMSEMTASLTEDVVLKAKTDEERMREEMEALQADAIDEAMMSNLNAAAVDDGNKD